MSDVVSIIVPALISAAISTLVGVIIRQTIERKFAEAAAQAAEQKKRRVRFTQLRSAWMWAAGRVLYHLVRWAQNKKQPNGDLDSAFCLLEKVEQDMKDMERQWAAEAQEE
jgi:hypothetical protein